MYNMVVEKDGLPIVDTAYKNHARDWSNITNAFPSLSVFDECIGPSMYLTNVQIIIEACKLLNISAQITSDHYTHLRGTERLINLCKTFGADRYLSGISGLKYLDLDMFEKAGIEVVFQDKNKMDNRPLFEVI